MSLPGSLVGTHLAAGSFSSRHRKAGPVLPPLRAQQRPQYSAAAPAAVVAGLFRRTTPLAGLVGHPAPLSGTVGRPAPLPGTVGLPAPLPGTVGIPDPARRHGRPPRPGRQHGSLPRSARCLAMSDNDSVPSRSTALHCGFIEDAPVFLDRAADITEPGSASLAQLFDLARDAWMDAVTAGALDERDWEQDPDETAANDEQVTDDEWSENVVADDDVGEDINSAPSRPATTRRRRRPANLFDNQHADAGDARSSRVPQLEAAPLTLEELYADSAAELRVALRLAARMLGGSDNPLVAPHCVSGIRVIVFVELFDPMCLWLATVAGALLTFCSCGSILGSGRHTFTGETIEHLSLQVARNKLSTCRHARTLRLAYNALASEYEAVDMEEQLDLFPDLAGANGDKHAATDEDTAVHLASHSGKKREVPIFANSESVWSPSIVRLRSNKHHLDTCSLLSCYSRPWGCIHSQAVNEYNRLEAAARSAAAAEFNEALHFGPASDLNDYWEQQQRIDPVPPSLADAVAPSPSRLRRARNMFPCASEVRKCDRYAAVIDACRTADEAKILDYTHAEITYMYCNTMRVEGTDVASEEVVLYCIRGRLTRFIGSWVCV